MCLCARPTQASLLFGPQMLTNLNAADVVYVSVLPGLSEELLFRGGLLPLFPSPWYVPCWYLCTFGPQHRPRAGVAVAGSVFGLLHNNGGRNLAFSMWATAVGVAYGTVFVLTGNVLVPCLSHALSNLASAWRWRAARAQQHND